MSSVIFICNLALSNIGKENIQDLSDPEPAARACNQFYGHVRDTLLQSYPWRFAGKTEILAEITNTKSNRWLYAFARPTDCLKVRRITSELMLDHVADADGGVAGGIPYAIEGQTIYSGISPAYLEYTFRNEDPTQYPPMFIEALAWQLATRLAMPLTRDPAIQQRAFELGRAMQASAAAEDANEERETANTANGLEEARA